MTKAMDPVYEEVKQIKGRGAPARRPHIFEEKVTKIGGVFANVQDRVEAAFDKVLCDSLAALVKDLHGIVDGIHRKFTLMCEDSEVKSEEEREQEEKLREHLQKNFIKARESVEGPIKALADECKNYSAAKAQAAPHVPGY